MSLAQFLRIERGTEHHLGRDRMELEFEIHDDAKVAAAAFQGPEQIGIFGFAGADQAAIGSTTSAASRLSQLSPCVPRSQPMPPERSGPPHLWPKSVRRVLRGQMAWLRHQHRPRGATFDERPVEVRRYPHAIHQGHINHQATIADGIACNIVAATAHRDDKASGLGVVYGGMTSAALRHRTISAGRLSIMPFHTTRVAS